jgi:hypothetical protein
MDFLGFQAVLYSTLSWSGDFPNLLFMKGAVKQVVEFGDYGLFVLELGTGFLRIQL